MDNIHGRWTNENRDWLIEENKSFEPIYKANQDLSCGIITADEHSAILVAHYALVEKYEVFQQILSRIQQLNTHPRNQLVYEVGWLNLFDVDDSSDLTETLFVSVLCALCFSGLFSVEYQSGMIKVIASTPLGKKHTIDKKMAVVSILCLFITTMSLIPKFWISLRDYTLNDWTAPIYSIEEFYTAPEIPLFMVVGLMIIARYLAVLAMAFIALGLSQLIKNSFGALFTSLLVLVLTPLLGVAGLSDAKWISAYPLFHICDLLRHPPDIWAGVLLMFLAILIVYIVRYYIHESFGVAL